MRRGARDAPYPWRCRENLGAGKTKNARDLVSLGNIGYRTVKSGMGAILVLFAPVGADSLVLSTK